MRQATTEPAAFFLLHRVPHRKTDRRPLHVEAQPRLSADRKDNRVNRVAVSFLPASPSHEPGKIPLPVPVERIDPGVADT